MSDDHGEEGRALTKEPEGGYREPQALTRDNASAWLCPYCEKVLSKRDNVNRHIACKSNKDDVHPSLMKHREKPVMVVGMERVAAAVQAAVESIEANICGKKDCGKCAAHREDVKRIKRKFPAVTGENMERGKR